MKTYRTGERLVAALLAVFGRDQGFTAKEAVEAASKSEEIRRFISLTGLHDCRAFGQVLSAYSGTEVEGVRLVSIRRANHGKVYALVSVEG